MQIFRRKLVEFLSATLKENNGIGSLYVLITELFLHSAASTFVLSEQQVCRITCAALTWKHITQLLHLDIGQRMICQLYDNVCF